MEIVKKTIYRIMTTGTTAPCSYRNPETGTLITGCTATTKILIPDTGVTYSFKINLNQEISDLGFFDAYMIDTSFDYINIAGIPARLDKFKNVLNGNISLNASCLPIVSDNGNIVGESIPPISYVVTGKSSTRLSELRKYVVTNNFSQQYVGGGSLISDGVDYARSHNCNNVVYYLGGIRYNDVNTGYTTGTTFKFTTCGVNNCVNFINKPIYKNINKENIISNPKIYDDVFIVRKELSVFDNNYRLEYVQNLSDLTTYASGSFYNIVNNS